MQNKWLNTKQMANKIVDLMRERILSEVRKELQYVTLLEGLKDELAAEKKTTPIKKKNKH